MEVDDQILLDISHKLGQIETKVDNLAKLPDRVSSLEQWAGSVKGALALATLMITLTLGYIISYLKGDR